MLIFSIRQIKEGLDMSGNNVGVIIPKRLVEYAVAWIEDPKNQNSEDYIRGFKECLDLLQLKENSL